VLEEQEGYSEQGPVEQVHLIGYDTLIRLLDTKYYPPDQNLKPLEGLFEKHRVRVTRRTDDAWGGREEQDEYLRRIAEGEREADGGRREWAQRIELVEGKKEGEEIISSTKVRKAANGKDEQALSKLVADAVASWILKENLYLEED
jgi:nicotinamide-nucleotide adenylyltransferase